MGILSLLMEHNTSEPVTVIAVPPITKEKCQSDPKSTGKGMT